jgi:hypothetical protein
MKALSETVWNKTLTVLQICGRIAFTGAITFGAYSIFKEFGEAVAYIAAAIACLAMIAAYTSWLDVMAWVLLVVIILIIGFAVLAIIISPPELSTHNLMVIGVVLLALILVQLVRIANKQP